MKRNRMILGVAVVDRPEHRNAVCVVHGPDARVQRLVDLYIKPRADRTGKIWIEGKRVENPPEGPPLTRGVFDPDDHGPIFISCGPHDF